MPDEIPNRSAYRTSDEEQLAEIKSVLKDWLRELKGVLKRREEDPNELLQAPPGIAHTFKQFKFHVRMVEKCADEGLWHLATARVIDAVACNRVIGHHLLIKHLESKGQVWGGGDEMIVKKEKRNGTPTG